MPLNGNFEGGESEGDNKLYQPETTNEEVTKRLSARRLQFQKQEVKRFTLQLPDTDLLQDPFGPISSNLSNNGSLF